MDQCTQEILSFEGAVIVRHLIQIATISPKGKFRDDGGPKDAATFCYL